MIAAPSICDWIRSGLTNMPQSMAVSTWWTVSLPLSPTDTSTMVAI